MLDLNTLLPQGSWWKALTPRCFNDRGQIAGIGIATDGKPLKRYLSVSRTESRSTP